MAKRAKPKYFGVSALGYCTRYSRGGSSYRDMDWFLITDACASREIAWQKALSRIEEDEYNETLRINLRVVSKTSLRKYKINLDSIKNPFNNGVFNTSV